MKKQPKVTPWFPADVNPVREGFYECLYAGDSPTNIDGLRRRYFDGKIWRCSEGGVNMSFGGRDDQWRGLTKAAA